MEHEPAILDSPPPSEGHPFEEEGEEGEGGSYHWEGDGEEEIQEQQPVAAGGEEEGPGGAWRSRVIHVRNLAPVTTEKDLARLVMPFGQLQAIKLLTHKNQAFIQMATIAAAEACINYFTEFSALVRKRRIFMQFSTYRELDLTEKRQQAAFPPNKILLVTAPNNDLHASAMDLAMVFSQYGPIEKVLVPLHSSHGQAFVQFYDLDSAIEARQQLNSTSILQSGITIHVHFSKMENLVAKGDNIDFVAFDEQQQAIVSQEGSESPSAPPPSSPGYYHHHGLGGEGMVGTGGLLGEQPGGPPLGPAGSHHHPPPYPHAHPHAHPHLHQPPPPPHGGWYKAGGGYGEDEVYFNNIKKDGEGPYGHHGPLGVGKGIGPGHHPMEGMMEGPGGPKGAVLLVTGLDPVYTTCDVVRNLFFNYGDVVRIKRLVHKPDHALVEMADAFAAANAINLLRGCILFGRPIKVAYSKHPHIFTPHHPTDTEGGAAHPQQPVAGTSPPDRDGAANNNHNTNLGTSPSSAASTSDRFYKEYPYHSRKRLIFKHLRSVSGPSPVLYVSHLPKEATLEVVSMHMQQYGEVVKLKTFESGGRMQALVEYKDAASATNALVLAHHSLLLGRNIWVAYSKNSV